MSVRDGHPLLHDLLHSQNMPGHTSREILLLMGSLTTCDPGDIQETINNLKSQSIRCSVIGTILLLLQYCIVASFPVNPSIEPRKSDS